MLTFSPFKELEDTGRALDRLFSDSFLRAFDERARSVRSETWTPPVDLFESSEDILLDIELPGFRREDIDVNVGDGRLTVSGERKHSRPEGCECHRLERSYGKFSRTFTLPPIADVGKISASLKEGVLTIAIPKREESKARHIEVKS